MKNPAVCKNCHFENPYYRSTCLNCKSYIRDRVYNLDFWKTFAKLLENPFEAFKLIIFSEQKNFIFFIMIFAAVKFLINARFAAMLTLHQFQSGTSLFVSYILILACLISAIFFYSYLFTLIGLRFKYQMRIKDNFAILCYSQILSAAALFVLFPIELILFGDYLFSINPTPFAIKGILAYLLLIIELIVIGWSGFLTYAAFFSQLKNISASILSSVLFWFMLTVIVFISSLLIFTL